MPRDIEELPNYLELAYYDEANDELAVKLYERGLEMFRIIHGAESMCCDIPGVA